MIEIKGQADMNEEMSCGEEIKGFAESEEAKCKENEVTCEAETESKAEAVEEKGKIEAGTDAETEDGTEKNETEDVAVEESEETDEDLSEKPEKKERKLKWAKKEDKDKDEKKSDPLAEANEKYLRLFAEFDNFRKRTDKEKSERYDMGARDIIEKILPVLDNFERGFSTVEEGDKEDAFVTGMDLVYKQFLKVLEDVGVQPIEALGKEFDPELHNAVMHVDDPDAGENIIVEEFQKGYTYKGHIVRYSMVKVAN